MALLFPMILKKYHPPPPTQKKKKRRKKTFQNGWFAWDMQQRKDAYTGSS